MTTDVHQQRMEARPFKGRRCSGCGVTLYEAESARQTKEGFIRVDVCIHCETNGPPRRPQGSPPAVHGDAHA